MSISISMTNDDQEAQPKQFRFDKYASIKRGITNMHVANLIPR